MDTVEARVARAFADVLRQWLTPDEWAEMHRRNATYQSTGACASHDFCDANMAMLEAFKACGVPFETDANGPTPATARTWSRAWNIAARDYL